VWHDLIANDSFAGCTDREGFAPGAAEGTWRWITGATCDNDDPGYAQESWGNELGPWDTGEPNNGGSGEDCMIVQQGSRDWDDRPCEQAFPYLCERDR